MELNKQITLREFEEILQEKPALMVYFYQDKCGVCKMLYPKVKALIETSFPKMEMLVLEAEQNIALAAQLRMLAVPGIMVYFDGREFFRANGLVTIGELQSKIERLYGLMFEEGE
ncbi:thioredoxin family protein [Fontibacter flavus]|uniref:Thioredoxin family protein n=1 Tax=Fontibacter flavus TaxID=654838 RepID=A0ABV6FV52_9BACT